MKPNRPVTLLLSLVCVTSAAAQTAQPPAPTTKPTVTPKPGSGFRPIKDPIVNLDLLAKQSRPGAVVPGSAPPAPKLTPAASPVVPAAAPNPVPATAPVPAAAPAAEPAPMPTAAPAPAPIEPAPAPIVPAVTKPVEPPPAEPVAVTPASAPAPSPAPAPIEPAPAAAPVETKVVEIKPAEPAPVAAPVAASPEPTPSVTPIPEPAPQPPAPSTPVAEPIPAVVPAAAAPDVADPVKALRMQMKAEPVSVRITACAGGEGQVQGRVIENGVAREWTNLGAGLEGDGIIDLRTGAGGEAQIVVDGQATVIVGPISRVTIKKQTITSEAGEASRLFVDLQRGRATVWPLTPGVQVNVTTPTELVVVREKTMVRFDSAAGTRVQNLAMPPVPATPLSK